MDAAVAASGDASGPPAGVAPIAQALTGAASGPPAGPLQRAGQGSEGLPGVNGSYKLGSGPHTEHSGRESDTARDAAPQPATTCSDDAADRHSGAATRVTGAASGRSASLGDTSSSSAGSDRSLSPRGWVESNVRSVEDAQRLYQKCGMSAAAFAEVAEAFSGLARGSRAATPTRVAAPPVVMAASSMPIAEDRNQGGVAAAAGSAVVSKDSESLGGVGRPPSDGEAGHSAEARPRRTVPTGTLCQGEVNGMVAYNPSLLEALAEWAGAIPEDAFLRIDRRTANVRRREKRQRAASGKRGAKRAKGGGHGGVDDVVDYSATGLRVRVPYAALPVDIATPLRKRLVAEEEALQKALAESYKLRKERMRAAAEAASIESSGSTEESSQRTKGASTRRKAAKRKPKGRAKSRGAGARRRKGSMDSTSVSVSSVKPRKRARPASKPRDRASRRHPEPTRIIVASRYNAFSKYSPADLNWRGSGDERRNSQDKYCYCGGSADRPKHRKQPEQPPRPLLRCRGKCGTFFHQACSSAAQGIPVLWGMDDDVWFECGVCGGGTETLKLEALPWTEISRLALLNLAIESEKEECYFRTKAQICPFIERHWLTLCNGKLVTPTWSNTIAAVVSTHRDIFVSGTGTFGTAGYWTLSKAAVPSSATVQAVVPPMLAGGGAGSGSGAPPRRARARARARSRGAGRTGARAAGPRKKAGRGRPAGKAPHGDSAISDISDSESESDSSAISDSSTSSSAGWRNGNSDGSLSSRDIVSSSGSDSSSDSDTDSLPAPTTGQRTVAMAALAALATVTPEGGDAGGGFRLGVASDSDSVEGIRIAAKQKPWLRKRRRGSASDSSEMSDLSELSDSHVRKIAQAKLSRGKAPPVTLTSLAFAAEDPVGLARTAAALAPIAGEAVGKDALKAASSASATAVGTPAVDAAEAGGEQRRAGAGAGAGGGGGEEARAPVDASAEAEASGEQRGAGAGVGGGDTPAAVDVSVGAGPRDGSDAAASVAARNGATTGVVSGRRQRKPTVKMQSAIEMSQSIGQAVSFLPPPAKRRIVEADAAAEVSTSAANTAVGTDVDGSTVQQDSAAKGSATNGTSDAGPTTNESTSKESTATDTTANGPTAKDPTEKAMTAEDATAKVMGASVDDADHYKGVTRTSEAAVGDVEGGWLAVYDAASGAKDLGEFRSAADAARAWDIEAIWHSGSARQSSLNVLSDATAAVLAAHFAREKAAMHRAALIAAGR